MSKDLTGITRFDQLVRYLRDELDWPIESDSFEDLTFEYTPEELGIDPKNAAKIQEIKRLRPLAANQPWGIFFVKFEPRKLPVVALRRILGSVALKKRASANHAERQAWAADDLLFVSNYGEGEARQINFAHFTPSTDAADLPTLKVLGWDSRDTALHIGHVADTLRSKLVWPEDESDLDHWRNQWRSAFRLRHREVITTSRQLSERLAELAVAIRERIRDALGIETDKGPLTQLLKAFQAGLVHDLDADGLADMYAQTIAYGLLSARIVDPKHRTADDFAAHMRTNPFLRELMETFIRVGGRQGKTGGPGIDFDELGVSDVVQLLDEANMEAVVRDFGDRNPQEDPVIHFYEDFIKQYDKSIWKGRGVIYTPRPVVSYIVRSVDELLRTEFGLEDGLADTTTWGEVAERHDDIKIPDGVSPDQDFVQILDPATGTGTFLVEVIELIHAAMMAKWKKEGAQSEKALTDRWNEYVPKHLLPRLHGYELLMAPYAIAHLKIGLKLFETGYRFESDERARVYLTNSLEPASDKQHTLEFLPALAHEVQAVNAIKNKQRFTVVIGNPPYLGEAGTGGEWIAGLMRGKDISTGRSTASYFDVDGQPLNERNSKWINDDYVKFVRLSQFLVDATGIGVHGFISNHGYLDNPTFRGMRWALMASFDKIYALDLHGNIKKKENPPDGGKDVNVFEIEQGVGIGLFTKRNHGTHAIAETNVNHADLWGERQPKYDWLSKNRFSTTHWTEVEAAKPFFLYEPLESSEVGDYFSWPAINDVMPINSVGIVTSRDQFAVDMDRKSLAHRVSDFVNGPSSDQEVREEYLSPKDKLSISEARKALRQLKSLGQFICPLLYRPFDQRWIIYHTAVIERSRYEVMPHMQAGDNVGLVARRAMVGEGAKYFFVSNEIISDGLIRSDNRGSESLFPLYLFPGVGRPDQSLFQKWPEGREGRRPNLDPGYVGALVQRVGLTFISDGRGDLAGNFGPEDVLAYIYSVFHSPEYRRRFEPMLKLDFPRVPLPIAADLFAGLARRGHDLLALHLLESPALDKLVTRLKGSTEPEVEKVSYSGETVWLDKDRTYGFQGVADEVWNFHIGGYQVCEKWLKDRQAKGGKNPRPGRKLTGEEIAHYQKIVVAISDTIRIMAEIDEVIDQHGGWPDAFQRADGEGASK